MRLMPLLLLLLLVVAPGLGCFAPDVDVDSRGLRPALAHVSAARSSGSSDSGSSPALASKVDDVEEDVDKLEKKLDDLKDDVKKLESRVKKLEKKLD